jgi:hypothetical protein
MMASMVMETYGEESATVVIVLTKCLQQMHYEGSKDDGDDAHCKFISWRRRC